MILSLLMRKTIRFKQSDIKVKLGEYDFDQVSVISSVQEHLIVNRQGKTCCVAQEGETKDQTFTVASMKIHERYDDVSFENDIAILKLNGVATR